VNRSTYPRHLQPGTNSGLGWQRLEKYVHNVFEHQREHLWCFWLHFLRIDTSWNLELWQNRAENGKVDVLKIVGMKERVAE